MTPWIETFLVSLLAGTGVLLGRWFSRLHKPYWTLGFFLPLLLLCVIIAIGKIPSLMFVAPTSWLSRGRTPFALIGFIATLILTTPLSRVPTLRIRILVNVLMVWMVAEVSLWPFLAPSFNHAYLASLRTNVDSDGVCRQSNHYNCGPAAAVTALRKLGFAAEEGEIAIAARTSSATGTPPDMLARALQRNYSCQGLICECRLFKDLAELKRAGLTLAVIKYGFLVDHYVVVLEVTDAEVVIADPLCGKKSVPREQFVKTWRSLGIVMKRVGGKSDPLSTSRSSPGVTFWARG